MNVYIAYSSNSGNTMLVARGIAAALEARGHAAMVKNVSHADIAELAKSDAVLLGCPSWLTDGQEGQPTAQFNAFAAKLRKGPRFDAKPFGVFGCGRHEYTKFTGAVEMLERLAEEVGGVLVIPSLRIDGFPHHQSDTIAAWANELADYLGEQKAVVDDSATHRIPIKRAR